MKALAVVTATLVVAGCGTGGEGTCDTRVDVSAVGVLDPVDGPASGSLPLRVGQTVRLCMFGLDSCRSVDHRFDFRTDAPAVVTVGSDPSGSRLDCNELFANQAYDCCPVAVGRLTAVSPGEAHVEGVLLRGSTVEKSASLMWCDPYGPGSSCRAIAIEVRP